MDFYCMNLSDFILLLTGLFVAWQARETYRLAELTRVEDQPLLELEIPNNGVKVLLKNIGQSPAYSTSISSIKIATNEHLDFDPLETSRFPILPGKDQEIWMYHQQINEGSIKSFAESIPVLKKALIERNAPLKVSLKYYDKVGEKLSRDLYIKIGGNKISGDQQIYVSTNPEA